MRYTHQQPKQSQELAEPREARPSGAMRVVSDAEAAVACGLSSRSGSRISRPNAPVRVLPSILVDPSYLQAVSSVVGPMRARRRNLALAAAGAFLCGMLTLLFTAKLVRHMEARATAPVPASSVVKHAEVSLQSPLVPMPADSAPPHRTRMDRRDAARQVHDAQELRRSGRVRDARRLLAEVLKDRSGYPPGLAAMAELELDCGRAVAAVRWARLAVRALPSSVENRELLRRANVAAGLGAEGARARVRGVPLSDPGFASLTPGPEHRF